VIGLDGRVVSRHVRGLPVVSVVVHIRTDAVVRSEKEGLYIHERFVHPWTALVQWGYHHVSEHAGENCACDDLIGCGSIFPNHTCIRQWEAELCLKTNSEEL
jgi:hypothetical protein